MATYSLFVNLINLNHILQQSCGKKLFDKENPVSNLVPTIFTLFIMLGHI